MSCWRYLVLLLVALQLLSSNAVRDWAMNSGEDSVKKLARSSHVDIHKLSPVGLISFAEHHDSAIHSARTVLPGQSMERLAVSRKATAWVLLGNLVITVSVFYLANSSVASIKGSLWKTLSGAMSIVCAILIDQLIQDFAGNVAVTGHNLSVFRCVQLVVTFVTVHIALVLCMRHPFQMAAWSMNGAHLVGFTAAGVFAEMQEAEPWRDSVLGSLAVVVIAMAILVISLLVSHTLRKAIYMRDGIVDDTEIRWIRECVHSENEIVGFCLGALITQTCRFALVGFVPHLHGKQTTERWASILGLFCCGLVFGLLTLFPYAAKETIRQHIGMGSIVARSLRLFEKVMGMSMSWSMFFVGRWLFWKLTGNKGLISNGDIMTASMVQAVIFFGISFVAIASIDWFASRYHCKEQVGTFVEAFIVIIALSWETCCSNAVSRLEEDASIRVKSIIDGVLCVVICALVMPAWILYILPHSLQADASCDHGNDLREKDQKESEIDLSDASQGGVGQ